MPNAYKQAGLYVGLLSTMGIGLICIHCMHIVVRCASELCQRLRKPSMSFSEVSFNAFHTGPEGVKKFGFLAERLVSVFICITQLGGCAVYFVFIATNLQEIIETYYGTIRVQYIIVALLIPMILLNFVRNLKYLAPLMMIASILTVLGNCCSFIEPE